MLVTRNRAAYLEQALEKTGALLGPEDELIVVDGGSTDETADVVRRYAHIIDQFVTEPDVGEGHATNKGYLLANGRYVKELTDDDVIHPAAMAEAVAVMDAHPEVDVLVCGGVKLFGEERRLVWLPPGTNFGSDSADVFRYGCCGIGWLIRRSVFAKVGLMNPHAISLDLDFTSQAISRGANVRFCRINMYEHPVLPHSTSVARRAEMKKDQRRILKTYTSRRFYWMYSLRSLAAGLYHRLGIREGLRTRLSRRSRLAQRREPVWDGGFS